jgi:hypothetical protein
MYENNTISVSYSIIDTNDSILNNVDINYKPAQNNYDTPKIYNNLDKLNNSCVYSHNTKTYVCNNINNTDDKLTVNNTDDKLTVNNTINTDNTFNDKHVIDKTVFKKLINNFPKKFNTLDNPEIKINNKAKSETEISYKISYRICYILLGCFVVYLLFMSCKNKTNIFKP